MDKDHTINPAPFNSIPQHLVDKRPALMPPARAHREIKGTRIEIDADRLEELAAARGGDRKQIARALGCSPATLHKRMSESRDLRERYARGVARTTVPVSPQLAWRIKSDTAPETVPEPAPVVTADIDEAPARSALIGAASDAELVLDAIRHKQRTAGRILDFTGLTNFRLRRALEELEADFRVKLGREPMQHFYLSTEELPG